MAGTAPRPRKPLRADVPREKEVQRQIRRRVDQRRMYHWKTAPGSYGTPAGTPDLCGCYRSVFVGLEVKRPTGNSVANPVQRRIHAAMRASGAVVEIVRSVEEADDVLDQVDDLLAEHPDDLRDAIIRRRFRPRMAQFDDS